MNQKNITQRVHQARVLSECLKLEDWKSRHLVPTLLGDVEAAGLLYTACCDDERGWLAVALWRFRTPKAAYREFLLGAWEHAHRQTIANAKTRGNLRNMFRYAEFMLPDFPAVVRVWRGTCGMTEAEASKGLAWTTNRDVACWFAMRFAERHGGPLVLTADVPRDRIAMFSDELSESECVVFDVSGARVDGAPDDWTSRYESHEAAIRSSERAFFS